MYCLTRCYIGKVFNIADIAIYDTCFKFYKNPLHIDRIQNSNGIFQMIGKTFFSAVEVGFLPKAA